MAETELQPVWNLLDGMRHGSNAGARVAALRGLLARLNYAPRTSPAPLQSSVQIAADDIADPPSVLATGAADHAFHVIHTRLATADLPRTVERAVVSKLLNAHPYALFVFSNVTQDRWHLLNVKSARAEASDENRDPKLRRLFRRISVGPEDRLRTATERVERLDLEKLGDDLSRISPLALQAAHDDAFDVEAVTRQFFHEYKRVFDHVEGAITGLRGPDKRRLFVQRLFNRLMFIAFIQKKGWLKFPARGQSPDPLAGMEENEYLEAVWCDYQTKKKEDANFYADRLAHLFFRGLNNPAAVDMLATNRGHSTPDSFLQRRIGDVPYLNGGLFEKSDDGTDEADAGIVIPDKAVDAILGRADSLFKRFNFTVTESTPLDVEVAVDPEMLGKVFEELVTDRHESGSYYTPKPIVSFMCREALKGHLETKCPAEKPQAVARFVDGHDAAGLRDGEAVLDALKTVKCCDPACGSGAYLLGMMHELLDLRQTLFKTDRKLDPASTYDRKLEIIQTNVYGVDLDPFAVNIARLRLWLSLAVDFDGETPPPLPNLDFKIESGDSLAAPDPSDSGQLQLQKPLVDEFFDLKRLFFKAHSTEKKPLKEKIDALRDKIRAWTHGSGALPENAFDWQVEFAEVFVDRGFNLVLANPPYVRQELIKDQKPTLKRVYGEHFSGTADLYVFFYLRALQLLAPGGMLAFISSNKWFRAGYGAKLRSHIARTTGVRTILDFHDLPVFTSAVAYPMIFVAAKGEPAADHAATLAEPPTLDAPYPDIAAVVAKHGHRMPPAALGRDGAWHLATSGAADRLAKMRAAGPTLRDFVRAPVYRGVTTGLNEAFVIDADTRRELIAADPRSREVIKPFLSGRDVKRWVAPDVAERWLIFLRRGVDAKQYPAVLSHLKAWKSALTPRRTGDAPDVQRRKPGSYTWYEIQDEVAYYEIFAAAKILSTKVSVKPTFTLDKNPDFVGNTSYVIPATNEPLFLLAVLNSSSSEYYAHSVYVGKQGGWYEVQPKTLESMPIPDAPATDRAAIAGLAQKCLEAKGVGCEAWEKEIDDRVAGLYGIDLKDLATEQR